MRPVVDQPFPFEHLEHVGPEQFGQWLDVGRFWHAVKDPSFVKEAIGGERVDMGLSSVPAGVGRGVPFGVIAEGLDRHDGGKDTIGPAECGPEEHEQARVGQTADFGEELAVEEEVFAQNDRDREDVLPVGMFSRRRSPNWTTFLAWHEGRNQRPRQEKASRNSWRQSGQRTRAKP